MQQKWQNDIFSLKDRTAHLLDKELWTDVTFAVCKKNVEKMPKTFRAHKLMLATASNVFAAMFFGPLADQTTDEQIQEQDVDAETFAAMLKYIYSDEIDLKTWTDAANLYSAAEKFMLDALLKYCQDDMLQKLNATNALKIYEFAMFYNDSKLIDAALKIIKMETMAVLDSPDFLEIDVTTMITILEQDDLQATEVDLFNALDTLATQCAIEDEPGTVKNCALFRTGISKINFLLMSVEQFVNGPSESKFLLSDESRAVLGCLITKNCDQYPSNFVKNIRMKDLPRVFLDVKLDNKNIGRIVMELRADVVPETVKAFLAVFNAANSSSSQTCGMFNPISNLSYIGAQIEGNASATTMNPENFILNHKKMGAVS